MKKGYQSSNDIDIDVLLKENQTLKTALIDYDNKVASLSSFQQTIINTLPDTIIIADLSGIIEYSSPGSEKVFGYTEKSQYVNHSVFNFIAPEDRERAFENFQAFLNEKNNGINEYKAIKADGSYINVEVKGEIISDENEGVSKYLALIRDLSSEKAIVERERRIGQALNNLWEGFQVIDFNWKYLFVNDSVAKHARKEKSELINHTMFECFPGIENTSLFSYLKRSMDDRVEENFKNEFIYQNGDRAWFEMRVKPIPEGIFVLSIDITEKLQIEKEKKINEIKFHQIFENSPLGQALIDINRNYSKCNSSLCKMLGYSEEEFTKMYFSDITHPDDSQKSEEAFVKLLNKEISVYKTEKKCIAKNGKIVWVSLTLTINYDDKGNFLFYLAIVDDITQRKKDQGELRETKERLDIATRGAGIGIWDWDISNNKMSWTEEMYKLYQISREEEQNPMDVWRNMVHPEDKELVASFKNPNFSNDNTYQAEYRVCFNNGDIRWIKTIGQFFYNEKRKPIRIVGINYDITSRKQAELKLIEKDKWIEQQNNQLNAIVRTVPDFLLVLDKEGNLENTFMPEAHGLPYKVEDVRGKNIALFFNEETTALHLTNIKKCLRLKKLLSYEVSFEINGIKKQFEGRLSPIDRKHVLALVRDVTERKESEERLKRSEENFQQLIHESPYGIRIVSPESNTIYANPIFLNTFGFRSLASFNKQPPTNWYTKESYREYLEREKRRKKGQDRVKNYKISIVNKNGARKHLQVFRSKILWNGKLNDQIIYNDITESEIAQEQISKLSHAVEQSPNSVYITNVEGDIEYANKSFYTRFGYRKDEVIGNTPRIISSGLTPQRIYVGLWKTIRAGRVWSDELINKTKDGELIWETVTISPVFNDKGEILNFLAINIDVSEKKKYEKEIMKLNSSLELEIIEAKEAKRKAEESDRLKSAFLANMSHEIRTPLNAIVGFAHLLSTENGLMTEEKDEFVNIIDRSSENLLHLINDILDVSKLETGQFKLNIGLFDVAEMLEDLFAIYKKKLADNDKNTVELKLKNVPSTLFRSDKTRITQILSNLLSNSIKFTNNGVIEFGIESISDGKIIFFVRDTGIGIKKEVIPYIFDRFRQADLKLSRQFGGTGLGLAIVKDLVELMNGKITLESEEKQGTTITILLPM